MLALSLCKMLLISALGWNGISRCRKIFWYFEEKWKVWSMLEIWILAWFTEYTWFLICRGLCGDSTVRQQRLGAVIPKCWSILVPAVNQKAVFSCVRLCLVQTDQMFNLQNGLKLGGWNARLKTCRLSQRRGEAGTCSFVRSSPSKFRRWRVICPMQLRSPRSGTTPVSLERWQVYLLNHK